MGDHDDSRAAPRPSIAGRLGRWLLWAVLAVVVLVVLFEVVFPWFESNYYNPTIG